MTLTFGGVFQVWVNASRKHDSKVCWFCELLLQNTCQPGICESWQVAKVEYEGVSAAEGQKVFTRSFQLLCIELTGGLAM